MFEAFFTDPCMRYRTEVINGIDFYGLGFSMVRGECVAEGTLRWMQEGEAAAVLITNTSLPDMSGKGISALFKALSTVHVFNR